MYILIKGKHTTVEEINNENIENENFEIISGNETESTTEEISGTETITEEITTTETIANETINIDYTTILQQTNTYLNFLIFMFVLFLMLNFVERK